MVLFTDFGLAAVDLLLLFDAAFVVVTGDLTDTGEPAAYEAFRAEISALSMPAHLMVGNHDDRGALAAAFPDLPWDDDAD